MLNPTDFIKYIKKFGFPNKDYKAVKDYPDTVMISNKKFLNEFGKKYNAKFILGYKDGDILLSNNKNDSLFYKSLEFISDIQKTLLNKNIESYISGGSAIKLYGLVNNYNTKNKNINNKSILKTSDFDMQLYIDNNKAKLENITILNNIETIINSISINIKNQFKNKTVLKIFSIINLKSKKDLLSTLEYFLNLNFDLYKYRIFKKEEDDDYTYYLDFIKKISNTSYIILNLKYKKNFLKKLNKCNGYCLIKVNTCISNNNKLYYIYDSIDIGLYIKDDIKLIKGEIKYNNISFKILNEKSILYNLINLYYDYKNLLNQMERKIKEGKDIRDEKRLDYFFKLYCKLFYKNMNNDSIIKTLDLIKLKNEKFNKCILKNLNVIDTFFREYNVNK